MLSGAEATFTAAATAAPLEMPQVMPSSRWSRLAISTDSSFETVCDLVDQREVEDVGLEARADALDLVRAGLGRLAVREAAVSTGEWIGSTATERIALPFSFLR